MIDDIRKHLEKVPFIPFAVRTTTGHEYPVPTLDHVYLPPGGNRVIVADDEGVSVVLPALHLGGLVVPWERPVGNDPVPPAPPGP